MKQSDIIVAVKEGRAELPGFVEVMPGVEVWTDALKVDGVRVGVTARTAQQVADLLGLSLTTAEIEDAISLAVLSRISAFTFNPSKYDIASDATEQAHSKRIDQALTALALPEGSLITTVGKAWVLTEKLLKHQGHAANYGWHSTEARYKSATGKARKVWQPLSFAHNLDHHDYSQTLRLCRCRIEPPGCGGVLRIPGVEQLAPLAQDEPLPDTHREPITDPAPPMPEPEPPPAPQVPARSFGQLCVDVARAEMAAEPKSSAATIAKYHKVAIRNGKPLGITKGNHCASAASWCMVTAYARAEVKPMSLPHQPRAAAKELMVDAQQRGVWCSQADVLAGRYTPQVGDLAIYDRSMKGRPETSWWGHVDRVTRIIDGMHYEAIGANEVASAWHIDINRFDYAKLLGFVSYALEPQLGNGRSSDALALPGDAVG